MSNHNIGISQRSEPLNVIGDTNVRISVLLKAVLLMGVGKNFSRGVTVDFSKGSQTEFSRGAQNGKISFFPL